jgi:hypothetical protein
LSAIGGVSQVQRRDTGAVLAVVAVVAVALLVVLFVAFQQPDMSRTLLSSVGRRFGDPPPPPRPAVPIDLDSRFDIVPRRRIVVPLVGGAVLLAAAAGLAVLGATPAAVFAAVVGVLQLGAAATAVRTNRQALNFLEQRLFDEPGSGAGHRMDEP